MKNTLTWVLILIILIAGGWFLYHRHTATPAVTTSDALPVLNLGTQATADDIVIDAPTTGLSIGSPVHVTGRARGSWYSEASAPVTIVDLSGAVLGEGHVTAQGDWMTSEFVPFTGDITFTASSNSEAGAVIFKNDNPSGDPARQKYFAVPVYFIR